MSMAIRRWRSGVAAGSQALTMTGTLAGVMRTPRMSLGPAMPILAQAKDEGTAMSRLHPQRMHGQSHLMLLVGRLSYMSNPWQTRCRFCGRYWDALSCCHVLLSPLHTDHACT